DFAARGFENIGAWIMGRNMFGPVRGLWSDDSWKGWWGEPALPRPRLRAYAPCSCAPHDGGRNDLHFVTDGIHAALERAKEAAQGKDVPDSAVALPPFASTSPLG